jgi:hypothetical protein
VSTPDGAGHAWPWLLEGKYTLDIIAVNLFARDRVNDGWCDAEEWQ